MCMPGFSAAASIYRKDRQFPGVRQAANLSTQSIRTIYPAMEIIEVSDCPPGHIKLGDGENIVCIPVSSPGGHEGPIPPSPPGDGGGDGGGGGDPVGLSSMADDCNSDKSL